MGKVAETPVSTEADPCRKVILPRLQAAGWENDPHSLTEQRTLRRYGKGRNAYYAIQLGGIVKIQRWKA